MLSFLTLAYTYIFVKLTKDYFLDSIFNGKMEVTMPRPGSGSMGHSKHYKSGHSGHNRDMIQTARKINQESEKQIELQKNKKPKMFDSVKEAFKANRKPER